MVCMARSVCACMCVCGCGCAGVHVSMRVRVCSPFPTLFDAHNIRSFFCFFFSVDREARVEKFTRRAEQLKSAYETMQEDNNEGRQDQVVSTCPGRLYNYHVHYLCFSMNTHSYSLYDKKNCQIELTNQIVASRKEANNKGKEAMAARKVFVC